MSDKTAKGSLPSCVRVNALLLFVLLGIGVGLALGFGLRKIHPSEEAIMWIGLPGEVYMRLLKMTILPLIVSTIITGTASIDPGSNGRITSVSFIFILITNSFGAILGIVMYFIFKPGVGVVSDVSPEETMSVTTTKVETSDMFADMIRNLFPDNMITACFQKTQTMTRVTTTQSELNITTVTRSKETTQAMGVNILGLIVVSTLFGIAASKLGPLVKPFLDFFSAVSHLVIMALNWIIVTTPFGVASLIASAILKVTHLEAVFNSLGMFVLALSVGIGFYLLVLMPFLYFIVTRNSPLYYIASSLRAWMTVFSVASSAIGMPELLKVVENKLHVDKRISRYTVPLGVALTRAGSAQFITLSSLFLINLEGIVPNAATIVLVWLLTTVSSLAIPSIPSAGIVTVLIVLSSLNINITNIGLLMALEWYDDRIRSTNNANSIVMGAVIANKFCKSRLPPMDLVADGEIKEVDVIPDEDFQKTVSTETV